MRSRLAGWMEPLQSHRGAAIATVGALVLAGAGLLAMLKDNRQQLPASTWRELARQAPAADTVRVLAETPLKAVATVAARPPEQVPLLQTLAANEELVIESRGPTTVVLLDPEPVARAPQPRPPDKRSPTAAARSKSTPTQAVARTPRPGPQEACSDRSFFMRPFCVHRRCEEPQFRKHAQCIELDRQREARLARAGPR